MASFKDLPDELLVKIFAYIEDTDITKIRLERVSKRFYRCLRESWKYSGCSLDLGQLSSVGHSAAFFARVPQITRLRLRAPQYYHVRQLQQLFQSTAKLRVSKLEYIGPSEDADYEWENGCCSQNAQLITWCLSTFGPLIKSLEFTCSRRCSHLLNECRTAASLMRLLPLCHNLQHLHLIGVACIVYDGVDDDEHKVSELLQDVPLKCLALTDVAEWAFGHTDLIEVLNSQRSIERLNITIKAKQYEKDKFVEFCQSLNAPAARMLTHVTVPLRNLESLESVGTIHNFLPNLRNLNIEFDWRFCERYSRKEQDAGTLVKVVEEFIANAGGRGFEIRMNLSITKNRQSEYHFGKEVLKLIDNIDVEHNFTKRNSDACNWKTKLIKDNVTVCINANIIDLYTIEANDKRLMQEMIDLYLI